MSGNRDAGVRVNANVQESLLPLNTWIPSRAEALDRLNAFVARSGRTYAAERNFDWGPAERHNVSTLSPYLRTRTISESEVLAAVLGRHSAYAAQKFVQEVFWRTYWKGWLQAHPAAWPRYQESLAEQLARIAADARQAQSYANAIDGRTGIDAFDAWARELVEHNYLHNHARMWFASIWIFTLGLPWELGADFFMRHLLDGDPASNTLSWRWVAGLHTRGRTYLATRDNIRRYTAERFELASPLARSASPLDDPTLEAVDVVPVAPLPTDLRDVLLLVHDDDLHADLRELPHVAIRGVVAVETVAARSPQRMAGGVVDFTANLAREATSRIAAHYQAIDLGLIEGDKPFEIVENLSAALRACCATSVVIPFAPVGATRDVLTTVRADIAARGLRYLEFGRRYDAVAWPAATRGFFNLRSRIPKILAELGIGAGSA